MSVPGYGAEASLYRSTGQYRAAMMAGVVQPGGVAVPQQAEILPSFPFFHCSPPVCPPGGGVQRCCYWMPFGGYQCFTHQCPPGPPPQCRGLSGCALFQCECRSTGGIVGPPGPGRPCGSCIHE
jgi:hypothetical protein